MSSTKLLFLKPLLITAQRLLLNCGLKWISESLRLIFYLHTLCLRSGVLSSFSTVQTPALDFLFLRDPWSQNRWTLNLLSLWHKIYFLCSSIFCSLLFLVSEFHHLSESSPSILLWIPWVTVFRRGTGQQAIFCYLPAPLPPLASCLNLSSSLSSFWSSLHQAQNSPSLKIFFLTLLFFHVTSPSLSPCDC